MCNYPPAAVMYFLVKKVAPGSISGSMSTDLKHFASTAVSHTCLNIRIAAHIGKCLLFDILGNTLIHFLAESEIKTLMPLSCLYVKYQARASRKFDYFSIMIRSGAKKCLFNLYLTKSYSTYLLLHFVSFTN